MTLDELYEIKDRLSKMKSCMTKYEMNNHHRKITEKLFDRVGKNNFIPTDKPNVWIHIPKPKND
jgi:hypothetical protein